MKLVVCLLCLLPTLAWAQDYNVPFRPRAVAAGDCAGATNWLTHAARLHCMIMTDSTWTTSTEPDDECGQSAASGSAGLTVADDAVTTGLPSGTAGGSYYLNFDPPETNEYVALPLAASSLSENTDWFISGWLKVNSSSGQWNDIGQASGSSDLAIHAKDDAGVTLENCVNGNNCLGFQLVGQNLHFTNAGAYVDGTWVHAVFVFDSSEEGGGTDTVRIYTNGVLNGTALADEATFTGTTSLWIGYPTTIPSDWHELLVVDSSITAAQACQLMQCGADGASADESARNAAYGDCSP